MDSATVLTVRERDAQRADILLRSGAAEYSVSGIAPGVFSSGSFNLYAGDEAGYEYRLPNNPTFDKDGHFSFSRVPPGTYELKGRALDGNDEYLVEQPLRVEDGDIRDLAPAALKTGALRILVSLNGAAAAPHATPMLEEVRTGHRAEVNQEQEGVYLASEVQAGVYTLFFEDADTLCVDAVSVNGQNATLPLPLRETAENEEISVRLTDRCGTVAGSVSTAAHARLVVTAEDLTVLRVGHTARDGRFLIPGLPLGRYRIFALESLDGVPYRNARWLRGVEYRSVAVNLGEQASKTGVLLHTEQ